MRRVLSHSSSSSVVKSGHFSFFSTVVAHQRPELKSTVTGAVYSPDVRVVPNGMTAFAVPDSDTTVELLAEEYVNFTLRDLGTFQRKVVANAKQTEEFYGESLMKGFGSGGSFGGGGVRVAATATASASPAASPGDPSSAATPAEAPAAKKKVEKATFDVKLAAFAPEIKIKLIKELRTVTNLPLGDAKAAIDKCPGLVQTNMSKSDAEKLKAAFEALGASVELL